VGIFYGTHKVVANSAANSTDSRWFTILDGLLALGELASWTMVGIGGIGWIISRRSPVANGLGPRGGLDA
jgi:hypothetical protein